MTERVYLSKERLAKVLKPISGCGCCGRIISHGNWCSDCLKHISANSRAPMWERTYFAQFQTECPFEVKGDENEG